MGGSLRTVREGMESRVEIICRLMISWRAVVKGGKKEQFSACPNSFESPQAQASSELGQSVRWWRAAAISRLVRWKALEEGMAESASLLRRDAFSTSDSC
jgi:hypothetical protein